jgi:hypothetical protein
VSAGPQPPIDTQALEQERRRLSRYLEEIARLAEGTPPPSAFYGELLKRLLESLAAPAGAVWTRTAQGNLQLQFHINMKEVGVDSSDEARQAHEELLRHAVSEPRPLHLLPRSGLGSAEGRPAAGNPSDLLLLLVPVLLNNQVVGLIEVWQGPGRPPAAIPGFLQFMGMMADLAARYQRNQVMGQMAGQQQLWTKLEDFARKIHGSLNPTEVAYLIVNDARRLIECDRVSVAVRYARKAKVVAVSGVDVVETRSDLVQRMRTLCDRVLEWGEKLVFNGTRDDGLPPKVLEALDAYLEVSASKLLVLEPLRDEREGKEPNRPARAALLMECFEPPAEPQQIMARLDVVNRHATSALYNAVEHKRIPMRWVWLPLAKLQEGIGGKGKAITALCAVALGLLVAVLVLVPYPLKMEAKGELLPEVRVPIYSPVAGIVKEFTVKPGEVVGPNRNLAVLFDKDVHKRILELTNEMEAARQQADEAENQARAAGSEERKRHFLTDAAVARLKQQSKLKERDGYARLVNARVENPGYFDLKTPDFTPEEERRLRNRRWTVLNGNFKEEWTDRAVTSADALIRLGAREGPWEIELKIPQKHIGQVQAAFDRERTQTLDVDFLLRSDPTHTYRGKLDRKRIAGEAMPGHDDNNEPEPYVLAYVRLDDPDIEPDMRLPLGALTSGTEVHAKVRCGKHALGYALFYGVWEFLYEKVVFFF